MADVAVTMTSEEADLWRGIMRGVKGFKKMGDEVGKTAKKSKEAAKESRNLERAARRVWESTRTPMERHGAKMKELNHLYAKGKIGMTTYARAVKRSHDSLNAAAAAGKKAAGPSAIAQVGRLAGAYIGVGAAIGGVTKAISAMESLRQEAIDRNKASRLGLGSLAQLAHSDADMKRLVGAARKTFAEGGADTLGEAGELIFSLQSADAMKHRKLFTELKAVGAVDDPAAMARASHALQTAVGRGETGGKRAIVSKAFGASDFSPVSAEQILEATARSGPAARRLKISDEAIMAATAQVASAFGSAEMGGTYVAQMMATLEEKGDKIAGKTLLEKLRNVKAMKLSGEDLKKFWGRRQGKMAYQIITGDVREAVLADDDTGTAADKKYAGPAKFSQIMQRIKGAEKTDRVSGTLKRLDTVPALKAATAARKAKAKLELGEEDFGTSATWAETVLDDIAAQEKAEGMDVPTVRFRRYLRKVRRKVFDVSDEQFFRRHLDQATPATQDSVRQFLVDRQMLSIGGPNSGGTMTLGQDFDGSTAAGELRAAAGELRQAAREAGEELKGAAREQKRAAGKAAGSPTGNPRDDR